MCCCCKTRTNLACSIKQTCVVCDVCCLCASCSLRRCWRAGSCAYIHAGLALPLDRHCQRAGSRNRLSTTSTWLSVSGCDGSRCGLNSLSRLDTYSRIFNPRLWWCSYDLHVVAKNAGRPGNKCRGRVPYQFAVAHAAD